MNKTISTILSAAAVVMATVSCQKSVEPANPVEDVKGTIEIRVNGLMGEYTQVDGTKASLVNNVRVSWEGGETVFVYDGTECLGSLAASLDENGDDRYALLSTDTDHTVSAPADGTTKLTLVYSPLLTEAPAVSDGAISISLASQSGAKAPFVAYATLDYTGTTITDALAPFKFATSVIRVNCTGLTANTAIDNATLSNVNTKCKLTLSGTTSPTVSSDTNGIITRTGDEYFAANKVNTEGEAVFQIAVPKLENTSGARVLTVAQGSDKVKDRRFATNSLNPATSVNTVCQLVGLPAGALAGEFSVQDGAGQSVKQVHFSKGNLTCNISGATPDWKFYEHQYDCATGYDATLITLFTWGYDATKSIDPDGKEYVTGHTTDGESFDSTEDWGTQIGDGNTWRTLTKDEWDYLFNTRTMTNDKSRYSNAVNGVTIENTTYKGVFIYPDNYNGDEVSSSMTWDQINAAGIVFLPATGHRSGSRVFPGEIGYYWSSTAYDGSHAFIVYFDDFSLFTGFDFRNYGFSVRLVTE